MFPSLAQKDSGKAAFLAANSAFALASGRGPVHALTRKKAISGAHTPAAGGTPLGALPVLIVDVLVIVVAIVGGGAAFG